MSPKTTIYCFFFFFWLTKFFVDDNANIKIAQQSHTNLSMPTQFEEVQILFF